MKKLTKFLLNKIPRPMLIQMSVWARPLIYQFFKGDQFFDPIDGRSYRKFLPYGYGKQRENALSPGTLSLERHRQMWLYLQNETDFFIFGHNKNQCSCKGFVSYVEYRAFWSISETKNVLFYYPLSTSDTIFQFIC